MNRIDSVSRREGHPQHEPPSFISACSWDTRDTERIGGSRDFLGQRRLADCSPARHQHQETDS